jgi:hypothetical protein
VRGKLSEQIAAYLGRDVVVRPHKRNVFYIFIKRKFEVDMRNQRACRLMSEILSGLCFDRDFPHAEWLCKRLCHTKNVPCRISLRHCHLGGLEAHGSADPTAGRDC